MAPDDTPENGVAPGPSGKRSPVVTVRKLDPNGRETWRYQGQVVERGAHHLLVEAYFDREDTPVEAITLRKGDRFLEIYFDNRWYNIFEIHDRAADQVKGWYCNISFPALLTESNVSYRDLALDLLVYPDGQLIVLDEDEFIHLPIDPETQKKARSTLDELIHIFKNGIAIDDRLTAQRLKLPAQLQA